MGVDACCWDEFLWLLWCGSSRGGGCCHHPIIIILPIPILIDNGKVNLSSKCREWAPMGSSKCLILMTSVLTSHCRSEPTPIILPCAALSVLTEPSHMIIIITGAGRGGNNWHALLPALTCQPGLCWHTALVGRRDIQHGFHTTLTPTTGILCLGHPKDVLDMTAWFQNGDVLWLWLLWWGLIKVFKWVVLVVVICGGNVLRDVEPMDTTQDTRIHRLWWVLMTILVMAVAPQWGKGW